VANYIYVAANGTDVENAAELQAAYTTAQGMSPSATNRIIIIGGPGNYNFGSTLFTMDTDYIDLVSLDGNRSIIFNSSDPAGTIGLYTVTDVYVRGVDVQTKAFAVYTYHPGVTVENCKGGDYSFSAPYSNMGGKFINCEGGAYSFADASSFPSAVGTFIDCKAGVYSFGRNASGTFTNCTAGNASFGFNGSASGTFVNCTGGDNCFAQNGTASGIFINCRAGMDTFASNGIASGTFTNCISSFFGFAFNGTASGVFNSCIGGDNSFGSGNTLSGTCNYCVAGFESFGGSAPGVLTGKLYYCRLTSGSFKTVSGAGVTRLCIDGSNVENNQG